MMKFSGKATEKLKKPARQVRDVRVKKKTCVREKNLSDEDE